MYISRFVDRWFWSLQFDLYSGYTYVHIRGGPYISKIIYRQVMPLHHRTQIDSRTRSISHGRVKKINRQQHLNAFK